MTDDVRLDAGSAGLTIAPGDGGAIHSSPSTAPNCSDRIRAPAVSSWRRGPVGSATAN
ncbi:hypothetical protein [Nocardia sp. Root136]|uniref:hypothetical protein n=1 Tax=Nocardia sp. Root136 TaxID=1736458 RepID=UPI001F3219A5|nr:hypothetical protein [Nocardia sp. Root136]